MRVAHLFLLCVVSSFSSLVTQADTVNFKYDGGLYTGTGGFSYASSSGDIALVDLTEFSFNLVALNREDPSNYYAVFRPMTLASLHTFSATVDGQSLISLFTDTAFTDPISSYCGEGCAFGDEEFHAAALHAYTCAVCSSNHGETLIASSGPVTQTGFAPSAPVPEPTTFALLGAGAIVLRLIGMARLR
jgi:hypothetical protein